MWNFILDKCSFYVVYFSGLKYPLSRVASDLIFSNPAGAGFGIADPAGAGAGAECS